jgi:hypothetical protein
MLSKEGDHMKSSSNFTNPDAVSHENIGFSQSPIEARWTKLWQIGHALRRSQKRIEISTFHAQNQIIELFSQ